MKRPEKIQLYAADGTKQGSENRESLYLPGKQRRFRIVSVLPIRVPDESDTVEVFLPIRPHDKRMWGGHYNGCAGHVQVKETVIQAARRELIEELGCLPKNAAKKEIISDEEIAIEGQIAMLSAFVWKMSYLKLRPEGRDVATGSKWLPFNPQLWDRLDHVPHAPDLHVIKEHFRRGYWDCFYDPEFVRTWTRNTQIEKADPNPHHTVVSA